MHGNSCSARRTRGTYFIEEFAEHATRESHRLQKQRSTPRTQAAQCDCVCVWINSIFTCSPISCATRYMASIWLIKNVLRFSNYLLTFTRIPSACVVWCGDVLDSTGLDFLFFLFSFRSFAPSLHRTFADVVVLCRPTYSILIFVNSFFFTFFCFSSRRYIAGIAGIDWISRIHDITFIIMYAGEVKDCVSLWVIHVVFGVGQYCGYTPCTTRKLLALTGSHCKSHLCIDLIPQRTPFNFWYLRFRESISSHP